MNEGDSFFADTTVLLYHLSGAAAEKQAQADLWMDSLWDHRSGRVSWQVIHEFYVNAVQKLHIPRDTARTYVTRLTEWSPVLPSHGIIHRAWHWCDTAKINFWDAMIVAAAEQANCQFLLSEDFQSGRRFDRLMVIDPFERSPAEFFS